MKCDSFPTELSDKAATVLEGECITKHPNRVQLMFEDIEMKAYCTAAATGLLLALAASPTYAATITSLYNGTLNTSPTNQGWLPISGNTPQTVGAGSTTLDTTSTDAIKAGYLRVDQSLNAASGYTLRFDLQLLAEDHSNPAAQNNTGTDQIADRAGLSIIALSTDKKGIELGFWLDQIWAQADGASKADPSSATTGTRFTHAEGVAFNTAQSVQQYDLSVFGNSYSLYANGNYSAPILAGLLRDYSPEGVPYNTSNLLFIGDNTTSARGKFQLNQVQLMDAPITPVPVPAPAVPASSFLFGLVVMGLRKMKQSNGDQLKQKA
jgi:hypothetical protein